MKTWMIVCLLPALALAHSGHGVDGLAHHLLAPQHLAISMGVLVFAVLLLKRIKRKDTRCMKLL